PPRPGRGACRSLPPAARRCARRRSRRRRPPPARPAGRGAPRWCPPGAGRPARRTGGARGRPPPTGPRRRAARSRARGSRRARPPCGPGRRRARGSPTPASSRAARCRGPHRGGRAGGGWGWSPSWGHDPPRPEAGTTASVRCGNLEAGPRVAPNEGPASAAHRQIDDRRCHHVTAAPAPRPPRPTGGGRRRGALIPTLVVLAALAVLLMITAQLWTEVLWFSHLSFEDVLWREWGTRAVLFAVGFVLMAVPVWLGLRLAYRSRPIYAPVTPEQQNLDRYRESVEPLRRLVMVGAPRALGLFAGISAGGNWRAVLMWLNREPFNQTDPEFGMDIGFFVFSLPLLRTVVSFLMTVVLITAVASLVTHYLYGGIQLGPRPQRVTSAARIQLSIMAGVFVLLIAANYWLDRYSLLVGENERFAGASFADINANLPARTILAVIAVIIAVLFFVSAFRGSWLLPAAGVGVMIVSGVVVGGIYPAIVQRFQVTPNAVEAESPFIQRNIDATLVAYGLDDIETQTYDAVTETEPGQLRNDSESTASIRLLDPNIVSPTFRQLQLNLQYYDFAQTLAVDRYEIDGENRDTVIAIRELNQGGLGSDQRTWVNDHTVYTHGFGAVAAYGNTVAGDGQPAFFEYGIPSIGEIGEYEE